MSDLFAGLGGRFVEPRIVIEAALPLELSGEAVRGRICVFTDEEGREWALRPDLTLPVAVDEVARRRGGASGEQIVRYAAPVFRLPALPGEPVEFCQAGFERFGGASTPETDAEVFAAVVQACAEAGVSEGAVRIGDLSVFSGFVDAMNLPPEIASGLKRAFRQEGGVRAFLNGARSGAAAGLAKRMQGMDRAEIEAFVGDIFALTGIRPVGERSSEEIVERLYQRAHAGEMTALPDDAKVLLDALLAVDVPAGDAVGALNAIAAGAGLSKVQPVLDALSTRITAMQKSAPDLMAAATFATRFGRRFTYYDGFVFEIAADKDASADGRPFAAGGRYDRLLFNLSGGDVEASAIGAMIVPHRLKPGSGGRA